MAPTSRPEPDGNLWFTANIVHSRTSFTGEIGRITPSAQLTLFPTPTVMSLPQVILTGPDSNFWFTEENVGIGRITTS